MDFHLFRRRRLSDKDLELLTDQIVQRLQQGPLPFPEPPAIEQALSDLALTRQQMDILRQAFLILEDNQRQVIQNQHQVLQNQYSLLQIVQEIFARVETIAHQTRPLKKKRKPGEEIVESDHESTAPSPPPIPEDPQMI